MDVISFSEAATANSRIEIINANPDSSSGVVTVPKVLASGETITIPSGRIAILPNVQIDGVLNVEGEVFVPSGSTLSTVVEKVTSTDNAIVRFNGATGEVQNSSILIDDNGNLNITGIGKRITGDFSNSTLTDRVAFQTSILNDSTTVNASPNGTGVMSQFITSASSDASNASRCGINVSANNVAKVFSDRTGTGSFLPLTFYTGGIERMRIDNDGNVGVGQPNPVEKLDVNGGIRTACASNQAVNTRGLTWAIDGATHGRLAVDNSSNLLYTGFGALGYGTGSGGTVTQLTSKSTTVTLNKPTGTIIMNNAALAAGAIVQFNVSNTRVNVGDTIKLTFGSGPYTNYAYNIWENIQTSGGFTVSLKNIDSINRSEAVVIDYTVIKGANS